ncbi:MAG: helix-turn-helix domain-containing protein [Pseudorhodoplanes sp.]
MSKSTSLVVEDRVSRSRLESLREITSAINATADLQTMFRQIVSSVCKHTHWWTSSITAVDDEAGFCEVIMRYLPPADADFEILGRWPLETSPSLTAVRRRQPVVIRNAQEASEYIGYHMDAIERGWHTAVILPLNVTDRAGRELAFCVHSRTMIEVDNQELEFLLTIGHLASIALTKAKSITGARLLSKRLEYTADLHDRLLQNVLDGMKLQELVKAIESVLGHPFIVLDLNRDETWISGSPDIAAANDIRWTSHVRDQASAQIKAALLGTPASGFNHATQLSFVVDGVSFETRAYIEQIRTDNDIVGGIIVFSTAASLDAESVLAAKSAKTALTAYFTKSLKAPPFGYDEVIQYLTQDDHDLSRTPLADASSPFEPVSLLAVVVDDIPAVQAFAIIQDALRKSFQQARLIAYRGVNFALLPCKSGEVVESRLSQMIKTIGLSLDDSAKSGLRLAASAPIRDARNYMDAYDSCCRTLYLAMTFGRAGVVKPSHFNPVQTLISKMKVESGAQFVRSVLAEIKASDQKRGSNLCATISAFLEHDCHYQATSDRLEIHISTLRYRIKTVRERFGFDLADPHDRLSLSLALQLDKFLEKTGGVRQDFLALIDALNSYSAPDGAALQ